MSISVSSDVQFLFFLCSVKKSYDSKIYVLPACLQNHCRLAPLSVHGVIYVDDGRRNSAVPLLYKRNIPPSWHARKVLSVRMGTSASYRRNLACSTFAWLRKWTTVQVLNTNHSFNFCIFNIWLFTSWRRKSHTTLQDIWHRSLPVRLIWNMSQN